MSTANKLQPKAGFSLTEMIVALGVMAALTLTVVASQIKRMPVLKLERSAHQLITDMRKARMQAAAANSDVLITFNNSDDRYSIWVDRDHDDVRDAGEVEVRTLNLDPSHDIWAHPVTGTFHPDGTYSTSAANGYISVKSPTVGYRYMYILPSGQVDPQDG